MTRRLMILTIGVLAVAVLALGCSSSNDKYDPVPIEEGVDVCEVCSMMVADDEYATQLILDGGRALKFDDIGDLFVWLEHNGDDGINVKYVRDFHTAEWIELEEATFAYDETFKTPMGFGVLSFKDKQEAQDYINEQQTGIVLTYAELADHHWHSSMDHHDHDHNHHHDHDHDDHDDHDHDDHDHDDHDDHDDDEHE